MPEMEAVQRESEMEVPARQKPAVPKAVSAEPAVTVDADVGLVGPVGPAGPAGLVETAVAGTVSAAVPGPSDKDAAARAEYSDDRGHSVTPQSCVHLQSAAVAVVAAVGCGRVPE